MGRSPHALLLLRLLRRMGVDRKSMSAERTFRDTRSMQELTGRIEELAALLCRQLEEKALKIKAVTLKLKCGDLLGVRTTVLHRTRFRPGAEV